ncbi:MAG: hypothetical protein ACRDV9_11970 [Acidimicrobiia bacterium]
MIRFVASSLMTVLGIVIAFGIMKRRPPGTPLTWSAAAVASVGVFALFILGYGIVPHEWLTWADSALGLREDRIMLDTYPIEFTGRTIRDVVVTTIYTAVLMANLSMWKRWQSRGQVKPKAVPKAPAPAGVSAFGRPVTKRD